MPPAPRVVENAHPDVVLVVSRRCTTAGFSPLLPANPITTSHQVDRRPRCAQAHHPVEPRAHGRAGSARRCWGTNPSAWSKAPEPRSRPCKRHRARGPARSRCVPASRLHRRAMVPHDDAHIPSGRHRLHFREMRLAILHESHRTVTLASHADKFRDRRIVLRLSTEPVPDGEDPEQCQHRQEEPGGACMAVLHCSRDVWCVINLIIH